MPRVKDDPTLVDWTPVTVRSCVCGGLLAANTRNPYAVEREVWVHQRSYQHRRWWTRSNWAQALDEAGETVDTGGGRWA